MNRKTRVFTLLTLFVLALLILVPIVILAFFAIFAGFANPTPLASRFGEGVERLGSVEKREHDRLLGGVRRHSAVRRGLSQRRARRRSLRSMSPAPAGP